MKKLLALFLFIILLLSGCSLWGKPGDPVVQPSPDPDVHQPSSNVDADVYQVSPDTTEPTIDISPEPTPVVTPQPTPTPDPHDYSLPVAESESVDDAWFADAVLIGDSRTDGMRLYSGIRGVDILCNKGLTVFEVMSDKPVIQTKDGVKGVLQALEEKQYAKVYISLGINELGYNDDQGYADTYAAMVDRVRELQSDADIYLQLLIPINSQKRQETGQPYYVTNKQIGIYNDIIRNIAVEKQVYLLDPGEVFTDENGELFYDASSDGIHFYRNGYVRWYEYLKNHTVKEENP